MVLLRGLGNEPTLVNGIPVRDAVLGPGDQVVFEGQHRFVVEFPSLPAPPPADGPAPAAEATTGAGALPRPAARLPWLLLAALLLGLVLSALLWFGAR